MAKKKALKKPEQKKMFTAKHGLWFLLVVFLLAVGFAAFIQGILMQWSFGFKYGFFSYLLAFIFIGVAKLIKWKLHAELGCCSHK